MNDVGTAQLIMDLWKFVEGQLQGNNSRLPGLVPQHCHHKASYAIAVPTVQS